MAYGAPPGNPDPFEPNPELVSRGFPGLVATMLAWRRADWLRALATVLIGCALLPFAYLLDGEAGVAVFAGGMLSGMIVAVGGWYAYAQIVWWRTGAWPQSTGGWSALSAADRAAVASRRERLATLRRWGFEVDDADEPGASDVVIPPFADRP